MTETAWGGLQAVVDEARCVHCGRCAEVCGGARLAPGLLPEGADPFRGKVRAAYLCAAADDRLRRDAQSGGALTALLLHQLDAGGIDRAVVTKLSGETPLRPVSLCTGSREEILAARGSKYCPTAACAVVPRENDTPERIAFAGLPCQVHSLRNGQRSGRYAAVELIFGLICDRTLAYGAMDYLLEAAGVAPPDAARFDYRSKAWRGWPGDVRVRTRDGAVRDLDRAERMRIKDAFTLPRCWLCFDKLNVLADLAFGDPHALTENPAGLSLVLVHTDRGQDVLREAERAGAVTCSPVDLATALNASEEIEERRVRWTACTEAERRRGRPTPDVPIRADRHAEVYAFDRARILRRLAWSRKLARSAATVSAARRHVILTERFGRYAPYRLLHRLKLRVHGMLRRRSR
jgi:coenzyme F420 hydrogenase subunit beta